ncbi:MAG: hypothetical protein ACNI25_02000 [Halarcobacter sp.]
MLLVVVFLNYQNRSSKNTSLGSINKNISYIKKENNFVSISKTLFDIEQKAKDSKVEILSFILKNSKISIVCESKKKQMAYAFLKNFKNSSIESTNFDKNKKKYITNAVFRIY